MATGPLRDAESRKRVARFLRDRLAEDTSAALACDRDGIVDVGGAAGPDADRQFREIATKRGLVQLCLDAARARGDGGPAADAGLADAVVRELVTVYADHPDYDSRWSLPDGADRAGPAGPSTAPAVDTGTADRPHNVIPFHCRGDRAGRRGRGVDGQQGTRRPPSVE